jgi:threonine synthase
LVSTAHPAKFENIVEPIIDTKVEIPENLKTILNLETSFHIIGKDLESLIPYLEH